jgi:hypothetical protein
MSFASTLCKRVWIMVPFSNRSAGHGWSRSPAAGLLVFAALLLAGCATHVPMSQTVLFRDAQRTQPTHRTGFGVGFAGTGQVSATEFLREEARERFLSPDAVATNFEPQNLGNRSFGLYGAVYNDGTFGASLTVGGGALGADVTAKLWRHNYLTASGSLYGGTQVLLQHRVLSSPFVGAAVGVGHRYGHRVFEAENLFEGDAPSGGFGTNLSAFAVHSVGGTGTALVRLGRGESAGVLGTLYVGYAPDFQRPIVTFGVTLGVF